MSSIPKPCVFCKSKQACRSVLSWKRCAPTFAHSTNGAGERGASAVVVDMPKKTQAEENTRRATEATVRDLDTSLQAGENMKPSWPLCEMSQPDVLKAVAVELMAQVMGFHSALLFVLVGATQPISGGHFNPMVSTMMAVWGNLPWTRLPLYVAAQLLGSALGSAAQFYALPPEMQDVAHAAVQAVPQDHTVAQAFLGETVAGFILMFMVCTVGLDRKGNPDKIPAVMALTIPALIYTVGPVSSMCINPARAFGPALVSGFWQHHWIWWTAPFIGGLLAVLPYKYMTALESGDQQKT